MREMAAEKWEARAARLLRAIDDGRRKGDDFPKVGSVAEAIGLDSETAYHDIQTLLVDGYLAGEMSRTMGVPSSEYRILNPVIRVKGRELLERYPA
jgi:hypothetical protein